jgi:hypothetical protein
VLMVQLQYKMKKATSDDLNKIGNLFHEKRFLGVSASFSGFITAFPSSFLSLSIILDSLFSYEIQTSVINYYMVIIIMIIQVIYVATAIIATTSIAIKINFNKKIAKRD